MKQSLIIRFHKTHSWLLSTVCRHDILSLMYISIIFIINDEKDQSILSFFYTDKKHVFSVTFSNILLHYLWTVALRRRPGSPTCFLSTKYGAEVKVTCVTDDRGMWVTKTHQACCKLDLLIVGGSYYRKRRTIIIIIFFQRW